MDYNVDNNSIFNRIKCIIDENKNNIDILNRTEEV